MCAGAQARARASGGTLPLSPPIPKILFQLSLKRRQAEEQIIKPFPPTTTHNPPLFPTHTHPPQPPPPGNLSLSRSSPFHTSNNACPLLSGRPHGPRGPGGRRSDRLPFFPPLCPRRRLLRQARRQDFQRDQERQRCTYTHMAVWLCGGCVGRVGLS